MVDDDEQPRESGMLAVSDGQRLYWEEWGTQDGVPAVYLHGGPGGTLGQSAYRHAFDLDRTRLVAFEQRGSGRSTPHASDPSLSWEHHTTAHLVADLERLRVNRGIDQWIVNGVSWGSTLALAYAQRHPERVLGLVLMAVTTTSREEVEWITETVGALYPEAWDRFARFAEDAGVGYRRGQGRVVEAYAQLLSHENAALRDAAAHEWALWEDTHVSIGAGGLRRDPRWDEDEYRTAFARLVTHYWSHDGFLDPPLLEGMEVLRGIPGRLIHGRRDVSSPAVTAWRVQRAWGEDARLVIDEGDGHGGSSMGQLWAQANVEMVDLALQRP